MVSLVLQFEGILDTDSIELSRSDVQEAVERLNHYRKRIRYEIENTEVFPSPVIIESFDLRFRRGSIIWDGLISLNATMEVMATLGGAYGFLQIIRGLLNRVLARWFERVLEGRHFSPIQTDVWVVSGPPLNQTSSAPRPTREFPKFTPWQVLVSLTLLNVILFLGGAIYTGVQVDSIQQRYQEATDIINDAESKYREAETSLELVLAQEARVKDRLATIAQTNEDTLADLERRSVESRDRISEMLGEADKQLDALKTRRVRVSESMTRLLDETTEELEGIASQITAKLDDDLNVKSREMDRVETDISDLGNRIDRIATDVSLRSQQADNLIASIELNIRELNVVKSQLEDSLTGGDSLSVFDVWNASDNWLKTIQALIALSLLSAICGGLFALISLWRSW